jgi:hypothetical protein
MQKDFFFCEFFCRPKKAGEKNTFFHG